MKKKDGKGFGYQNASLKNIKLRQETATLHCKLMFFSYIIYIFAKKMKKEHEISVKMRYICVKSIHKGICCQDNLLYLCWNFDSAHNWNGILLIDSLLKIAKTKRTKIKTTDALSCQSICLSHQMVAASYSGKRERSIFFLFESFGNA